MKTLVSISFALITSLFLSSCREDFFDMSIDLDIPPHQSKLAAVSFLNSYQSNNSVLVSFSEGITNTNTDDSHQLVNDATISLAYNDQSVSFSLTDSDGVYQADDIIAFTAGTTYTMKVSNPAYGTITATQVLPEVTPIVSASMDTKKIHITFNDPAGKDNYYLLMLYKFSTNTGTFEESGIDPFDGTTYWSALNNGIIFNDAAFNGKKADILANHWADFEGEDTPHLFKIVLFTTTKDYYRYDRTFSLSQDAEGNPFVEPVIIHKNFDKGYGVFALMNKSEVLVEMP